MYIFADHGIFKNEFITTTNKYFNSLCEGHVHYHFCLGHDLQLCRPIVFDLLNNNVINTNNSFIL